MEININETLLYAIHFGTRDNVLLLLEDNRVDIDMLIRHLLRPEIGFISGDVLMLINYHPRVRNVMTEEQEADILAIQSDFDDEEEEIRYNVLGMEYTFASAGDGGRSLTQRVLPLLHPLQPIPYELVAGFAMDCITEDKVDVGSIIVDFNEELTKYGRLYKEETFHNLRANPFNRQPITNPYGLLVI